MSFRLVAMIGWALVVAMVPMAMAQNPIPISSLGELQSIGNDPAYPLDAAYQLTQDLEARQTAWWNGGAGFTPIGSPEAPFIGSFDGNGYTIHNLTIDRHEDDFVGLFGEVGAGGEITAITMENAFVRGNNHVGTIIGRLRGVAMKCRVTGAAIGDLRVGGIVGTASRSSMLRQLEAIVEVTGRAVVGGLVGEGIVGQDGVADCSAHGNVTGKGNVGGLVGYARDDWRNCVATGKVRGKSEVGGLMGSLAGGNAESCYAYGDVEGTDTSAGGLLGYGDEARLIDSHAYGSVIGVWYVGGLVGLHAYSLKWGSSSARDCSAHGTVIGKYSVGGLIGTLLGGAYNSHATGDVSGFRTVGGLVGSFKGGAENSHASGDVSGVEKVGGFAGSVGGRSTLVHSHATGNVYGTDIVGGFTGSLSEGLLENVSAMGAVVGETRVGGLVGFIPYYSHQPCYSILCNGWSMLPRPEVSLSQSFASTTGISEVGGLVGAMISGYVSASFAAGAVYGESSVGGLVGDFTGDRLQDSYSISTVVGVERVGGLVGRHMDGRVIHCYAAGPVRGENDVGGLIGVPAVPASLLVANFWDVENTGQTESGGGVGLPTEAMLREATFVDVGWDFEEVWRIREGLSYPMHRAQTGALSPVPPWVCGHTADLAGDCSFELPALLRMIQLFNAGGYHCAPAETATEDGYALGAKAAARHCLPHSGDYKPQDWQINLSELLRMVQFYSVSGYHACPTANPPTEDGYCPGPL